MVSEGVRHGAHRVVLIRCVKKNNLDRSPVMRRILAPRGQQIHANMNIIQRVKAPTPKFFRVLRTIGLALAAASGALLAAPIALPAAVISIAGYVAVAGSVATAVSQTAIQKEDDEEAPDEAVEYDRK